MRELSSIDLIGLALAGAGLLGLIWSPRWKRLLGARLIGLARYQEHVRAERKVGWKKAQAKYEMVVKVAAGDVEVMTFPPAPSVQKETV